MDKNLVLLGFMGTGKSAVGRILARKLGMEFVDLDSFIEKSAGCAIKTIFAEEGESGFRERERAAVAEVSAGGGRVIATGGGVVLDPRNLRDLGRSGVLVCLSAAPRTILARVAGKSDRPLLRADNPLERIRELLREREKLYASVEIQVVTDGLAVEEVAEAVIAAVTERTGSTWRRMRDFSEPSR